MKVFSKEVLKSTWKDLKNGLMLILVVLMMLESEAHAIPAEFANYQVTFTDPLFENWDAHGTTALFDTNSVASAINDLCGSLKSWTPGRAYDQHHGWDRDIPNDGGDYVVFAIAPGVVEKTYDGCSELTSDHLSCNGLIGNTVFIRHNSMVVSRYFHLRKGGVLVKVGDWVDRFHPIGYGGTTGNSSGAHLHTQIEINKIAVDPIGLAADWSPPLGLSLNNCSNDPQHNLITYVSLENYANNQVEPFNTTLVANGFKTTQNLHWLLQSSGGNAQDILTQVYSNGSETRAIAFDLTGHAPTPIVLPEKVYQWWIVNGTVGPTGASNSTYPGKPISDTFTAAPPSNTFLFEHRIIVYTGWPYAMIKQDIPYPENAAPGMFLDGWKAGKSYAIVTAFKQNGGAEKLGYPTGIAASTPFVHEWNSTGYFLQDFGGGTAGSCGIMLQNIVYQNTTENFKAYLMKGMMWNVYRAAGNGPEKFGHPLGDQYFDAAFNANRQDFEKGLSILESGDIIASTLVCPQADAASTGAACKCPGNTKILPCGNCGNQQWLCQNNLWVVNGSCVNQGVCALGEIQESSCAGTCGGKMTRTCTTMCGWTSYSLCDKTSTAEVCDNVDNDCDGLTDEGVLNACGSCGALSNTLGSKCGNCGTWQCDPNQTDPSQKGKLICTGEGVCAPESIKTKPCGCNNTVAAICSSACKWGMWDLCMVGYSEVCDGKDNDCDGLTDEGVLNACGGCGALSNTLDGPCGNCGTYQCDPTQTSLTQKGKLICKNEGVCANGTTQTQACGICGGTTTTTCSNCQWGLPSTCSKLPSTEVCDGKDNDCNGQTDEGVLNACGGCTKLTAQPNTSCGIAGTYQCASDKNSVTCKEPPPPPVKNECGGISTLSNKPGTPCAQCGTWQCSGTEAVLCSGQGTCSPNTTANQSCNIGGLCGGGTITNTCNSQCQWQQGTCMPTSGQQYAYDSKKVCGAKYCFRIASISGSSATGMISKPAGTTFGNFPMEWFVMNSTTNQVMGSPPGFGCSSTFTNQFEGSLPFALYTVQGTAQVKMETYSNTNCVDYDLTPAVAVQKCY